MRGFLRLIINLINRLLILGLITIVLSGVGAISYTIYDYVKTAPLIDAYNDGVFICGNSKLCQKQQPGEWFPTKYYSAIYHKKTLDINSVSYLEWMEARNVVKQLFSDLNISNNDNSEYRIRFVNEKEWQTVHKPSSTSLTDLAVMLVVLMVTFLIINYIRKPFSEYLYKDKGCI